MRDAFEVFRGVAVEFRICLSKASNHNKKASVGQQPSGPTSSYRKRTQTRHRLQFSWKSPSKGSSASQQFQKFPCKAFHSESRKVRQVSVQLPSLCLNKEIMRFRFRNVSKSLWSAQKPEAWVHKEFRVGKKVELAKEYCELKRLSETKLKHETISIPSRFPFFAA